MTQETSSDFEEVAEKTMLGDLMRIVLEQVKFLPKAWDAMSEADQQDYIDRIDLQCADAARQAIAIISSRGVICVPVTVDSVTFKDGVKLVAKLVTGIENASQGAIALAEAEGCIVNVIIPETEDLIESAEGKPEAEPDQRGMDLGHEYTEQ